MHVAADRAFARVDETQVRRTVNARCGERVRHRKRRERGVERQDLSARAADGRLSGEIDVCACNGISTTRTDYLHTRKNSALSGDVKIARNERAKLPRMSEPSLPVATLYRPVGAKELELVRDSGWRAFPPRLPEQPFFYPVLSEAYATQIARDWNTKDAASGFVGYVTRFAVSVEFLARYEARVVGCRDHQEYWVPADELDLFNANIVGLIEVVAEYRPSP
jgi:hypothetical protein